MIDFCEKLFDKTPHPTYVKQTIAGDDSILMFCASMITMRILHEFNQNYVFLNDDGSYTIKIDKMEWAFLYEIEAFLETFVWKE